MPQSLSQRQQSILEFIKQEIRQKGYPPSVREIGDAVGLMSSSTVHAHLQTIEEKGYIRRDPAKPRAIELLDASNPNRDAQKHVVHIPVVRRIIAGQPILSADNIAGTFPLPAEIVHKAEYFILHMQGNQMSAAGILDRDLILVRRQNSALNGEIVVVLLNGDTMIRRFYKEKTLVRLQPENADFEPVYSQDVTIIGKVSGVFRSIH
jgi:repressor LexA